MKNLDSDKRAVLKNDAAKRYFAACLADFRDLKKIILAGLMAALSVVLQSVKLPLTSGLQIQITFFISALSGAMFGPLLSLVRGAVADIVGFLLFPSGAFYLGYTLSAMLSAMVYSLFLYRQKITLWRIFVAKAIVSFGINAALGSLWNLKLMGSKSYLAYLAPSLAKNTVLLPIEVLVILLIFSSLIPVMSKYKLIEKQEKFEVKKVTVISLCVLAVLIGAALLFALAFPDTLSAFFKPIYKTVKDFFTQILVK